MNEQVQVINLSSFPLKDDMVSLLCKGLSFNPYATGDMCQTKIDVFKFVRNLKLKKHFAGQQNPTRHTKNIPHVFDHESLTIKDVQSTHLLLSLTDVEESPYDMERLLEELDVEPDFGLNSGLRLIVDVSNTTYLDIHFQDSASILG